MRTHRVWRAPVLLAASAAIVGAVWSGHAIGAPTTQRTGQYLVTSAGRCDECHRANFMGGLLPDQPPPGGARYAMNLRGLKMFATNEEAITFLMTAKLPDGGQARPPMPHFMFDRADAVAIATYLRSLH